MSLLGKAAVAMWWSVSPERRSEFGDWHSHEHFPERMSIPGFRRGSRWTSTLDAEGFFVLYELEKYETLTSTGYLDRLNAPTPWSTKMMPPSSQHADPRPVPDHRQLQGRRRDLARNVETFSCRWKAGGNDDSIGRGASRAGVETGTAGGAHLPIADTRRMKRRPRPNNKCRIRRGRRLDHSTFGI